MSKKILIGVITFVAVVISILLQMNFLDSFLLFGIRANIAIVIVCGIALVSGKTPGILTGITYGIFFDVMARKIVWAVYTFVCYVGRSCKQI